jgi:hypothetical protein
MANVLVMTLHSKLLARSQGFLTSSNGAMASSPHLFVCSIVAYTAQFISSQEQTLVPSSLTRQQASYVDYLFHLNFVYIELVLVYCLILLAQHRSITMCTYAYIMNTKLYISCA